MEILENNTFFHELFIILAPTLIVSPGKYDWFIWIITAIVRQNLNNDTEYVFCFTCLNKLIVAIL